jgi:outer membrane protein assembly factor BamD (BamD/ComL family)
MRPGKFTVQTAFAARPTLRGLAAALAVLLLLATRLSGADADEARAREALVKMFQDGLHAQVDRDAAAFVAQFPNSTNLPAILLLQAQARLALGRAAEAITLLETNAPAAGALADEFAFWTAEARLRKGDFAAAAEAFAALPGQFPNSARRLEAAVQEAVARWRAGDPARAAARLRDPDGPFQTAAKAQPADPWAQRGRLLLGQLLLELKDLDGARQVLAGPGDPPLPPNTDWERRLLLAQVEFAAGRWPETLAITTNLWTAVTNQLPAARVVEAALLESRAFEGLGQFLPALQACERGLAPGLPPALRRQALEKVIELTRQPAVTEPARARLQWFIEQFPRDDLAEPARLALGQALLREYYRLAESGGPSTPEALAARTNRLVQARALFDQILTNQPPGPLAPQAELGRAWTLWEEGPARLAEALAAFRNATGRLPPSEDQATARFQWAECQMRTADPGGALSNFWQVATNHLEAPIPAALRARALLGVVRAGIAAGNLTAAHAAAERLRSLEAARETAEQADLLLAEAYTRAGQPEPARAQYEAFLQRYPDSPHVPAVRLAIARAFEQRGDNGAALSAYASWLANYATNAAATGLVAQATFDLARITHRVDPGPGSLALLTNFIARFPDDPNAPLAQYLVAEQLFNQGDFARAELAFLDKLLDPARARPGDELPYRARLMAGKAAVFRQGWQSARDHFDWIITNGPLSVVSSRIPVSVAAEAYLYRGDLFLLEPRPAGSDPLAAYAEALNAFAKVAENFPTNELAPRAWGRIGDCNLQLATVDPKRYDAAAAAYQKVMDSPAGPGLRSMAEVGLGLVLRKQAALKPPAEQPALYEAAMTHFLNVLYGRNLREGEAPDPPWVRQAGLEAAELAESLQQWSVALGIYQRLLTELPPLRARLERKIEELRQRVGAGDSAAR